MHSLNPRHCCKVCPLHQKLSVARELTNIIRRILEHLPALQSSSEPHSTMPYSLNLSREECLAKASTQDSNDDEENISDFSGYPSNEAKILDLSGRREHSQLASTIRSVFEHCHQVTSVDDRSEHGERGSRVGGLLESRIISTSEIYYYVESRSNKSIADSSRLGGNVRTLRLSPNMIGNPVKALARVPLPIPPLQPISDESYNNDDEHYEDMEDGDEKEGEDEEEDEVIEIKEAREVVLYRVQQGSRAIRIKEMLRPSPVRAPVVPPPRSDSFNMIHTLSNPQGSQPLDQDTIFESGLESGFENPLRIKGLPEVPFEAGNIGSVGKSSVGKGRWPNERGGIWRKPVPHSADGPNSYFLHGTTSVQGTADSGGERPSSSPVAHPKQYASDHKMIGYSRLRAAKVEAREARFVSDAVNNYPPA